MNLRRYCVASLLGSAALIGSGGAHAADSIWAGRVGKILPTDDTEWCAIDITSVNGLYTISSRLQVVSTNGVTSNNNASDGTTKVMLEMQCYNQSTGVIGAPVSNGAFAASPQVSCPTGQVGLFPKCMMRTTDSNPFTYAGPYGDPCGNGVASVSLSSGNGFKGQVTGQVAQLNFENLVGNKIYNSGLMTSAQTYGMDMGFMFYSGGALWAGYGDTWANPQMIAVSPTNKRGSTMFVTNDLDPSDANGLSFSSYVGSPSFASEIVPSCHNVAGCPEVSAIGSAGFGLREGANTYRIVWFAGITSWLPFTATASVAWSTNAGAYVRGDQFLNPFFATPPRFSTTSNFGAGGVYQDRFGGYIYLFGSRPYVANTPIRLARVPATFASVTDQTKYEYWNGSTWVKNALSPMAPSETSYFTSAADIIPTSANPGPEFSVSFDAYANRYVMLFVSNRETSTAAVQLWQAQNLTGPWTRVTTGAGVLPNASMTGGAWPSFSFFYGPYMNEQIMRGGGRSIYYQLSEWNQIPGFQPYNVGLWAFDVNRTQTTSCSQ